jgi:hypothetical protein
MMYNIDKVQKEYLHMRTQTTLLKHCIHQYPLAKYYAHRQVTHNTCVCI